MRLKYIIVLQQIVISFFVLSLLSQTKTEAAMGAEIRTLQKDDLSFLLREYSSDQPCISGEIIIVLLSKKVGKNYNVVMSTRGKKISSVPTLQLDDKQFAILGIHHAFKDGAYTLSLENNNENKDEQVHKARKIIYIRQRKFKKENVRLNRVLSKKRKEKPSETVIAQAKKLWDITREFNEMDRYNYHLFQMPIKNYSYFSGMYSDSRRFLDQSGAAIDTTFHGGIDIAADIGTKVFVPGQGRVVFAGTRELTGKTVAIVHFPGMYTVYYHLNSIDVELDQLLKTGDVLGEVGSTGFSTGPHLHWEFRVHNVRVDPLLSMGVLDKVFILDIE